MGSANFISVVATRASFAATDPPWTDSSLDPRITDSLSSQSGQTYSQEPESKLYRGALDLA